MFTIQVFESKTGEPAYYKKVAVSFKGIFRGFTTDEHTDRNGEVHFDYENGDGTIFVQGAKVYEGYISGRKTIYI
ncbi:MAG: hypothetical protein LBN95_02875 [Prevotellaceae bacterium]|jgi:hypothetical protein|nr:hypothetical protein [Prevotellaceae bacterium]